VVAKTGKRDGSRKKAQLEEARLARRQMKEARRAQRAAARPPVQELELIVTRSPLPLQPPMRRGNGRR